MRTSSPPAAVLRQLLALRRRLAADAVRDAEHEAAVTGLTALEFADAGLVPFDPKLHILVARGFDGRRIPGVRYERTRRPPEPLPLRLPAHRALRPGGRRRLPAAPARAGRPLGGPRQRPDAAVRPRRDRRRMRAPARPGADPAGAAPRRGPGGPALGARGRSPARGHPVGTPGAVVEPARVRPRRRLPGPPGRTVARRGVAAEVDSVAYHGSPRDQARTAARRARLEAAGLLVLPVLPREIRDEPRRVVALLRDTLRRARAETAAGGRTAHRALVVQHAMW
ncbi:hypothetical protein ACU686_39635 [Yinghuangia aomiensis]